MNNPQTRGYITGVARVTNTSITERCRLRVCIYEELDPGYWVAGGCTWNIIARGHPVYYGFRLWSGPCEDYRGTKRFRSYVRFDGSNVRELGPIVRGPC